MTAKNVGIFAALTMAFLYVYDLKLIQQLKTERNQLLQFAQRDSSSLVDITNELGHQTQRAELTELSLRNAQELLNTQRLSFIKEFSAVKASLRNLETAVQVQATATADLKLSTKDTTIVIAGDTVKTRKFGYLDDYNKVSGYLSGDTTVMIAARIQVPIQGVVYWQRRKWLFLRVGRKEYYSQFTSPNSWVKIQNSEVIKVLKKGQAAFR